MLPALVQMLLARQTPADVTNPFRLPTQQRRVSPPPVGGTPGPGWPTQTPFPGQGIVRQPIMYPGNPSLRARSRAYGTTTRNV